MDISTYLCVQGLGFRVYQHICMHRGVRGATRSWHVNTKIFCMSHDIFSDVYENRQHISCGRPCIMLSCTPQRSHCGLFRGYPRHVWGLGAARDAHNKQQGRVHNKSHLIGLYGPAFKSKCTAGSPSKQQQMGRELFCKNNHAYRGFKKLQLS